MISVWLTPLLIPYQKGVPYFKTSVFSGAPLDSVTIEMPIKKPRGDELTAEQKEVNRACSHRRIAVEHFNSSIKRCRLLRAGCRDLAMEICCALHNFRVRLNPWLPIP